MKEKGNADKENTSPYKISGEKQFIDFDRRE